MTPRSTHDLLTAARAAVDQGGPLAPATQVAYLRDITRLLAGGVCSRRKQTATRYLAAWRWYLRRCLHAALTRWDHPEADRTAVAADLTAQLAALAVAITRTPGWRSAGGKRQGMSTLPPDWRDQLIRAAPCAAHRQVIAVLALSGCRPAELEKGIAIECNESRVVMTLPGAKLGIAQGQPWRTITWPREHRWIPALGAPDQGDPDHGNPRGWKGWRVRMAPARVRSLVHGLARSTFPALTYRISPSTFRHQLAADLKRAGRGGVDLAQALGHRSTRTQQAYGTARQGTTGGPGDLIQVSAAIAVRTPDRAIDRGTRHLVDTDRPVTR